MKQEGSYQIRNFAANVDQEIRRLKAQVELFWDKELRCLRMFGLADGMRILECGSGPGYILEKLLQAFPQSAVTGVEIDPFLVEKSRESLAARGDGRGRILEQSIMQMDFPENTFDFVIARLVLEHLPDPVSAVKEVCRVVKTGGKAVFIDNDFDMHLRAYPDIPELHELYEAYCRCRAAEGGNPRIGRELPGILRAGGLSKVDLEIVSAHSQVIGDDAFLKSEGSGIPAQLVKDGHLDREVMDRLARKWHEALHEKQHVFFRQLFVAVGEKLPSAAMQPVAERAQNLRSSNATAVHGILNANSSDGRYGFLTTYLKDQIAVSLRTGDAGIPLDRPLIDLGIDSLMSVELANGVARDFGVTISAMDILEARSIGEIAMRLNTEITRRKQRESASSPAPVLQDAGSGNGGLSRDDQWEVGEI